MGDFTSLRGLQDYTTPQARARWVGFVHLLREIKPPVGATLGQAHPLVFEGGYARLGCSNAFVYAQLEQPESQAFLEDHLREWFGCRTTLEVVRVRGSDDLPPTVLQQEEAETRKHQSRRCSPDVDPAEERKLHEEAYSRLQGLIDEARAEGRKAGLEEALKMVDERRSYLALVEGAKLEAEECAYLVGRLKALLKEAQG